MALQDEKGFLEKAESVGERVLGFGQPLVCFHYDADGVTAAAITALALRSKNARYSLRVLKRVDEKTLDSLPEAQEVVFVDLGSGQAELIQERLAGKQVAVIDHHPPQTLQPSQNPANLAQINAWDHGFDGGIDACGASTAYHCFKHLGLPRLAELGVVGAVGDMQERGGFQGLNAVMMNEAVESGEVFRTRDLRLFGRVGRPLVWFLAYSFEPFIPGLSGDEKGCALYLEKNGFPLKKNGEWVRYYDLPAKERKRFMDALLEYCHEKGLNQQAIDSLVGDVYLFLNEAEGTELRDAYEFSTLLNACGRHDHAVLGVSVCMGKTEAYEKAKAVLAEHRKALSQGISFAKRKGFDLGAFYLVDGRGKIADTVIGIVASAFLNSGLVERNKPVLGLSLDEEAGIKASGRGTNELVSKGLDLGEAMRKAGEAGGGAGGGHAVASGATIPNNEEALKAFLKKFKEVVEIQLELR